MKRSIFLRNTLLILCVSFGCQAFAEELPRTWHDIYGRQFEATLISQGPATVRLKNAEGKEIDFQILHLLPQDQQYIREWKSLQEAGAPVSEWVQGFQEDLVLRDGKKVSDYDDPALGPVKYFAFYSSASWCPPCRKFTPDLVKSYKRLKAKHPEFELIFVSSDRSKDEMNTYMVDYDMPWPAFQYGKHKGLVKSKGNGIPCLMVTDVNGTVLHDSYSDDGSYIGPGAVLKELEKLLKRS